MDSVPVIPIGAPNGAPTPEAERLVNFFAGKSEQTRKLYRNSLKRYRDDGYDLSCESLCKWIRTAIAEGKSKSTIANLKSIVVMYRRVTSRPFSETDLIDIGIAMDAVNQKCRGRGYGKAGAATLEQVNAAVDLCLKDAEDSKTKTGKIVNIRNACLLKLGFNALCRVSELSNFNVADFNAETPSIYFAFSKTDQSGRGELRKIGQPTADLLIRYIVLAGHTDGPLFRTLRGANARGRLNKDTIAEIVKQKLSTVSVKDAKGHSLRRGAATEMARRGATVKQLQHAGRWQDASVAMRYVEAEERNPAVDLC